MILVLAMAAVAFGPLLTVSADDTTSPIVITVDGPAKIGVGQKQMYKFTVVGGPAAAGPNGNYSWTAVLGGKYASQALLSASAGGPAVNGTFFFNVTAPSVPGSFYVTITGKSINATTNSTQSLKLDLESVNPIILKATIVNGGNVTIKGVPVAFLLNDNDGGQLIYNTTVDVTALSQATVSYNWTLYDLSRGKHQILVQIDPDTDVVSLDTGGKTATVDVYFGAEGYGGINAWLWAFVVVLAVLFYMIYRQPTKYKKKGVKKK
jgi:hypothetical protein